MFFEYWKMMIESVKKSVVILFGERILPWHRLHVNGWSDTIVAHATKNIFEKSFKIR